MSIEFCFNPVIKHPHLYICAIVSFCKNKTICECDDMHKLMHTNQRHLACILVIFPLFKNLLD